jgi:hypothetical protein
MIVLATAAIVLAGCGTNAKPQAKAGDTLSTRERQERIGAMPIPGARGVTRALELQDSGAARARQVDSASAEH